MKYNGITVAKGSSLKNSVSISLYVCIIYLHMRVYVYMKIPPNLVQCFTKLKGAARKNFPLW